jgi:hypothetical protein
VEGFGDGVEISDSATAGTLHVCYILIIQTSFRRQSFRILVWLSTVLASLLCLSSTVLYHAFLTTRIIYIYIIKSPKIYFFLGLAFLWATKNEWRILVEKNMGKRRRARKIPMNNIKIYFISVIFKGQRCMELTHHVQCVEPLPSSSKELFCRIYIHNAFLICFI